MSELNFPKNPVVGQEYTFNSLLYMFDGVKWVTKGTGYNPVQDLYEMLASDAGASFVGVNGYDNVQAALETVNTNLQAQIDTKINADFVSKFDRESLRRSYAEAGYHLVSGSFEAGATANNAADVVLFEAEGKAYSWGGTLPKTVPAGSTPASSGGLGAAAWIDKSPTTFDVLVESFRASNPTDSGCIQAAINSTSKGTIKLQPGKTYTLTTDIIVSLKNQGSPSGMLVIDATGAFITGTGNLVYDSSKFLKVIGWQMPNQDFVMNSLWFSTFESCIFRNLILSQSAGTSFSSSYWNSFSDCNFQSVIKYAVSNNAHNEFTFSSCKIRGNVGQGFAATANYAFSFIGNSNTQSWKFYGGDISYHAIDIYNIDPANTSEVGLSFDGVYFDTLYPKITDRKRTLIEIKGGHAAIGVGAKNPLSVSKTAAMNSVVDLHSLGDRRYKNSGSHKNLLAVGDMTRTFNFDTSRVVRWSGVGVDQSLAFIEDTTDTNKLVIRATTGAAPATSASVGFSVLGSQTSYSMHDKQFYSCVALLKSAPGFGNQSLKIQCRGVYENFNASETEQTLVYLTARGDSAVSVVSIASNAGTVPWGVDIEYIGMFDGIAPAEFVPSQCEYRTLYNRAPFFGFFEKTAIIFPSGTVQPGETISQVVPLPTCRLAQPCTVSIESPNTAFNKLIIRVYANNGELTINIYNPSATAVTGLTSPTGYIFHILGHN